MRMCGGRASIHFICVCVVFFFIIGRELEWRASEEEAEAERAQGSFSTRACIQRTFLILIFDLSARGTDGAGLPKIDSPEAVLPSFRSPRGRSPPSKKGPRPRVRPSSF